MTMIFAKLFHGMSPNARRSVGLLSLAVPSDCRSKGTDKISLRVGLPKLERGVARIRLCEGRGEGHDGLSVGRGVPSKEGWCPSA